MVLLMSAFRYSLEPIVAQMPLATLGVELYRIKFAIGVVYAGFSVQSEAHRGTNFVNVCISE